MSRITPAETLQSYHDTSDTNGNAETTKQVVNAEEDTVSPTSMLAVDTATNNGISASMPTTNDEDGTHEKKD